ncbi:hypothetical protein D3C75_1048300 [compost metagenome]
MPARAEMDRLVSTAKTPEIAMPCPAIPSVTCRSAAIGDSRLTGRNSEAISAKTHSDIAKTPLQFAGLPAKLSWLLLLPPEALVVLGGMGFSLVSDVFKLSLGGPLLGQ